MDYINSIYKLDTKGKVRVLTVSADNGILTQESGLLNGKYCWVVIVFVATPPIVALLCPV